MVGSVKKRYLIKAAEEEIFDKGGAVLSRGDVHGYCVVQ
jgi:hypothetical protein